MLNFLAQRRLFRLKNNYHDSLRAQSMTMCELSCERLARDLSHLSLEMLIFLDTQARKELQEVTVEELDSLRHALEGRDGWALVCMASITKNGRARQWCVGWMDSHMSPSLLPFLILRLNDWVAPIREHAKEIVTRRLQHDLATAFFECLPLIKRLKKLGRGDHSTLIRQVMAFLKRPDLVEIRETLLSSNDVEVRREVFRLSIEVDPHRAPDRVVKAMESKDSVLRNLAFTCFSTVPALQSTPLLETFLLDLNLVHRQNTQLVAKKADAPLADFYRRVIKNISNVGGKLHVENAELPESLLESPKNLLRAALFGLGEVGDKTDVTLVRPFLSHPITTVRRAAIYALSWLDLDGNIDQILAALADSSHRVSNDAARTLIRNAHLVEQYEGELNALYDKDGHCRENVEAVLKAGRQYRDKWVTKR